ncbi:hypothetical protein ASG29_07235 [Sphingomonas sp. Leaf412]|uniref:TorF family putative porin n=1 Tax=Sphingomonas sp. Leaf412 TaxID=1736370 RepID=UPI0006F3A088|nr:TorF family putative porin [Sphingomonas sp. Leaf412]KQT31715.1 hypothetical protein ASG29_07235 [Sphingomonas sp. Leaf412]
MIRPVLSAVAILLPAAPAAAQAVAGPALSVEAATDARVRGLSWSDGRPAVSVAAAVPLGNVRFDARATTLRGSARHGGSDIGLDTAVRYVRDSGGWRVSAGVVHHAFLNRAAGNYAEVEAGAGYLIGPLDLALSATWAPSQRAIGGDNLYLRAGAAAGVPGTPYTLYAHVGRSIGPEGRARATRLRPGGDYTDWRLGAERPLGPLALGAALTGTSIDEPVTPTRFTDRHTGTRLVATARVDF